jgi:UDP-N-acetylmuramate dehydrogenase
MPEIKKNINLKNYTTFKIGGDAEFFAEALNSEDLINLIKYSHKEKINLTIIGGGSNILISDKGIKGLTIINRSKSIDIKEDIDINFDFQIGKPRYKEGDYFKFNDLDDDDKSYEKVLINVSSGVNLTYLINETLSKGITGIQYFTAIPGSIGGAIFNNIHGGSKLIGDLVYKARLIDKKGNIKEVDNSFFKFDYDSSILHKEEYYLLDTELILYKGNIEKAKNTAKEWIKRKRSIQPILPSAGSIFKNITDQERDTISAPVNSAGWLIDNVGMKGYSIGGAKVYEKHANYIINMGFATQNDVSRLIEEIKDKVYKKFKIELEEEIIFKQ